ncbi:ABC transporter permease [Parasulfuritortus cantonensis]|uniref:ABC transporter permease n=1 Tax=Parasulfuritortus cantonensis TaxID=2528202 RepID=A0A4R1B837_9PROT|nr:ABC transporter permease [Parasulfuritortus cantonensis]TCJ12938.1 ABC transporter permease [Parasulfuritortus cantonensis]
MSRPGGAARGGAGMRLRGLTRKEFLQIVRDPSSIAIAFLMPIFLLVLFGYGVSLDAEHVPVAVVVEAPSPDSADFVAALRGSSSFSPRDMAGMAEAERALLLGEVRGIIRLRADFARRLRRPDGAAIQVIVDGVDANTARLVLGYAEGAWGTWLAARAAASGQTLTRPADLQARIWFNSELKSRNYLVPGLVAIIMTLIGALLTALVMAREWERGTMEALMVTPASMTEVLLGKLAAYFTLGTGGMLLTVGLAVWLFEVPLRGSFWLLWGCSSLFLLASLGMGLTISTLARSQFVAGEIAIIATFLPAFLLSGFIFDIGSMPPVVQAITHVVVARYFVAIVQTLFLAGDVWSVILPNAAALAVMAAIFLAITWKKSRKRLD